MPSPLRPPSDRPPVARVAAAWLGLVVSAAIGCGGGGSAAAPRAPAGPTLAAVEAARDLDGAVVGPTPEGVTATVAVVFASWCTHCREELPVLAALVAARPDVRVLGVNYRAHEEYDGRGDAAAVRALVATEAPWLRVVPADDAVWASLGRPPKIPTVYVFDRRGAHLRTFDRRSEAVPDLAALLAALPPP